MLVALSVRNIVLIDKLDIDCMSGLTAMTGETGAGKSIILDSLSLALGARGDGGLVREGEEQGQVTAVFDVPLSHPARRLLSENDIDDDGDIIIKRVQRADGRTKASVNDQPCSAALLKRLGESLVEIHGQHADRALIDADSHRRLVDAFGGLEADAEAVATAYSAWRSTAKELDLQRKRLQESENERDYLTAVLEELQTLSPEVGEEESLAERRQAMMNVEKVASDLNEAYEVVNGNASPMPTLLALMRQLERKADQAPELMNPTIEHLGEVLDALDNARASLEEAIRETDFDPNELEQVEERLFALRAAARKHKVMADDLPALVVQFMNDLEAIQSGGDRLTQLEEEEQRKFTLFDEQAKALSDARAAAAGDLANAVMTELPSLKLEAARFFVSLERDEEKPSREGYDALEFHVQTNPGTKPGAMMKVASGGELSRFLLALKVSLADKGSAPTLIFDEIDAGVGGAVAEAIGQRLARLAETVQVLCVTHAPQVAARANQHMLIAKARAANEDVVTTDLQPLDDTRRLEEVARMLAGQEVTDEARAAAARLIGSR